LDQYIEIGIESNLVLKQKELASKEAIIKLKEARGLFLPQVSLNARYTMSRGGRSFNLPLGDMMNPVYRTLNGLTSSDFPMMNNQMFYFQPDEEQETKMEVVQPVFNRAIHLNKQMQKEGVGMSQAELKRYKETLIFQIKESYYNVLKAEKILQLIQATKELVNENLRVSQKLFEHDMVTKENVLRSRTEVNKVALNETEAVKSKELAVGYINFLLNRPLDEPVEVLADLHFIPTVNQEQLTVRALTNRSELRLMDHQINSLELLAKTNRAANMPNLTLTANYGFLGEEYKFDSDHDHFTASLVLNWTLFKGRVNKHKRQQSLIQKQKAQLAKDDLSNGIRLEVKESWLELQRQYINIDVTETRSTEAAEVYKIMEKKYRLGESSLIELMDARTNMTEAEFSYIISRFDYLVSIAKLEYTTASSLIQ